MAPHDLSSLAPDIRSAVQARLAAATGCYRVRSQHDEDRSVALRPNGDDRDESGTPQVSSAQPVAAPRGLPPDIASAVERRHTAAPQATPPVAPNSTGAPRCRKQQPGAALTRTPASATLAATTSRRAGHRWSYKKRSTLSSSEHMLASLSHAPPLLVIISLIHVQVAASTGVSSDVACTSGSFPSEVSWELNCADSTSLSGGAPFTAVSVTVEANATCILTLMDSFGDGWNGAEWTGFGEQYSMPSGPKEANETFVVQHSPPPPPLPPSLPPIPPSEPPSPPTPPSVPPPPYSLADLRNALAEAEEDEITQILLPSGSRYVLDGTPLNVTYKKHVVIEADGDDVTISAANLSRIFDIIGGTLELNHVHLTDGNATADLSNEPEDGGAVMVILGNGPSIWDSSKKGTLFMRHGSITSCTAARQGGAIHITDGTVSFSHVTIDDCSASENGGAISVYLGKVTLNETMLTGCSAGEGGCVWASGAYVQLFDSHVRFGTSTTGDGGCIHCNACDLQLHQSSIRSCGNANPSLGYGGCAYLRTTGGTGSSSNMKVTSSVIGDCHSNQLGSCFYTGTAASIEMLDSELTNCSGPGSGSVYVASGSEVLFESSIVSNSSAYNGGAFYCHSGRIILALTNLTRNRASAKGGAVAVYRADSCELQMTSVYLIDNDAEDGGSALHVFYASEPDRLPFRNVHAFSHSDRPAFYLPDGISILSCNDPTYTDLTTGKEEVTCSVDTVCNDAPVSAGNSNETSPVCSCQPGAYPSSNDYSGLAPYRASVGCVRAARAEIFESCAEGITLSLRKTRSGAEQAHVNATLRLDGTETATYAWHVASLTEDWLSVAAQGGFPVASASGSTTVHVPALLDSSGLRESSRSYKSNITVSLNTPLPPNVLSIPVDLFVSADPVVEQCTVEGSVNEPVGVIRNEVLRFVFTARDVDGLPLDHGVDSFRAGLVADGVATGESLLIQYVGEGRHEVRVTLRHISALYQVNISLCPNITAAASNICELLPVPITLETLTLKPDFWRSTPMSADVRACLTEGVCVNNGSSVCLHGRTGPYCEVCEDGWHLDGINCIECPENDGAETASGFVLGIVSIIVALLIVLYSRGIISVSGPATNCSLPATAARAWKRLGKFLFMVQQGDAASSEDSHCAVPSDVRGCRIIQHHLPSPGK